MFFGVCRNGLALIAFLHFVSGPVQFSVASARLLKAWYCTIEYIVVSFLSWQQSDACFAFFAAYDPKYR